MEKAEELNRISSTVGEFKNSEDEKEVIPCGPLLSHAGGI
jgi:hypothetical protein